MARRRRYKKLGANAILAAGLFMAFSAALFTGMYFLYGKLGRTWRGVAEIRVLFAQVNTLDVGAPVRYDGLELGRVKEVRLVHADAELLKNLPALDKSDLNNLPLTILERERISRLPDAEVDAAARKTIDGRGMILAVLVLITEHDDKRLHEDDSYRVASSVLGDSSVELITGRGKVLAPGAGMLVLGVSADLISDIGKNMAQIQELMQSMAEIVGGEAGRGLIQNQLRNFDEFTASFDNQVQSMQKRVPEIWDGIDTRAIRSEENMNDVVKRVLALQPKVEEALKKTNDAIGKMHDSLTKSVDAGVDSLREYRMQGKEEVSRWHRASQEYREVLPRQFKDLRKTAADALSAADRLDAILERLETQMKLGAESARESLDQQTVAAMGVQEQTWQFKKSIGYFSSKYTPAQLAQRHLAWRYDMARTQYVELRRELTALQDGMSTGDPADRERARHVEQLLSESDAFFSVNRSALPSDSTAPSAEFAPVPQEAGAKRKKTAGGTP